MRLLATAGLLVAMLALAPNARAAGSIFGTRCIVCHQANARGIPGVYPPLADTIGAYVCLPQGRRYIIHVVIHGIAGRIVSHGVTYYGVMTSFASRSNATIAATLNDVLHRFNQKLLPRNFKPITAAEVKRARAANLSAAEMPTQRALLMKALAKAGDIPSPGGSR